MEYNELIDEITTLCITEPNDIDEFFSKTKCLNKLVEEHSLNIDLLEKISEESIMNIKKYISKYYNVMEKNSIDNDTRELLALTLLNHSNLLVKKYGINEKELVEKAENNSTILTREERKYLDIVKEAYNIKPDNTTKVKSYVSPVLSLITKTGVGYYITKKIKEGTNSTLLSGVVATGFAINTVVNTKNIIERNNFFANKKEFHKNKLNKKVGFFAGLWNSFKNTITNNIILPIKIKQAEKRIKNGAYVEGILGYKNKENELNYEVFRNNIIQTQNKKIEKYNKTQNEKINNIIIEKYSKTDNKHIKIINSLMELKNNALQIQYNRDLEKIYNKFPELKQNNVSLNNIIKGVFSSALDVISINSIPALYNCFCSKNNKENELKYKQCIEELNKIYKEYKKNKTELLEEHSNRLIQLNKEDNEIIDTYKNEKEIKLLKNNNEHEIITYIYNNFGVFDFKRTKNIINEINPETAKLKSLENFNYKNISNTSNEVITLILDNNVNEDVKLNNIDCFLTNISKLKDKGEDITKYQDTISILLVASNFFTKQQDLANKVKENYKQNIEQYIEPRYVQKINTKQYSPIYLSC